MAYSNTQIDKLRVVDLFSGCGGMSLGFENSGFKLVSAFDNWDPAISIYRDNFKHPISKLDLGSDSALDIVSDLNPDIIIGGPPCQDFSSAGKRDETLGRADLTISFSKIVSYVKPRFFVMENVERILKSKILKESLNIFKGNGYGLTYKVLNASYCGVPQRRKRFFLFGELDGEDDFLLEHLDKNISKNEMTLHNYFGNELNLEHYYRHPRSYKRRGVFSIHEPSPTIRGVNRPISKNYPGHNGDTSKDYKNIRPLTTKERSRIQTFPKKFILKGSKTNLELAIGNAVPVALAKYISSCLAEYIAHGQPKDKYRLKLEFD